jgi:protein TonB
MCSVLVHGVMALGAMALLSRLQMPLPQDQFTWNVAMVEPPKPQPNVQPAPEAKPKPTPPKPKAVETPPPSPQPRVETVQRKVIQTVQAVQQVVHRQVTQAVRTTSPVTTVNQTASVVTQAVQQSEIAQTVAPTAMRETMVQEEPVVSTHTQVLQQTAAPVMTTPVVTRQDSEPVVQHAPVETSMPVSQPQQIVNRQAEPVVERPVTESAGEPVAQPQQVAVEQTVAYATPAKQVPAAKADYGWLMKVLLGRVNELKRYPHLARINRWEGKVVLRAVIKDDGQVLMIDVQESSGREILDRDAIETLRKASPLTLEHPLGKPQVVIQMPISYSLR